MADVNFFEPENKEPERSGIGTVLVLVVVILVGVSMVMLSMSKFNEYNSLEKQKTEMANFIESPATKTQINEYYAVQADISRIRGEQMPITKAYADYRQLKTVTSSLLNDYIWGPIDANPEEIEFKSLSVFGGNLTVIARVRDISAMRDYQWALAGKTVLVDKDNADKLPGSVEAEGDKEINKFKNQFTTQIVYSVNPGSELSYEGTLGIYINKEYTRDMTNLLGRD